MFVWWSLGNTGKPVPPSDQSTGIYWLGSTYMTMRGCAAL